MKKHKWAALLLAAALSGCSGGAPQIAEEPVQALSSSAVSSASVLEQQPEESENAGMDPSEAGASSSEEMPVTVRFTIPEGYTLARVGMLMEEKKICTVEEWIAAVQNGDFSTFPLVAAQNPKTNRCFRLEGYLFPDTYEIYTQESPDSILRRILSHTEEKVTPDIRARAEARGYTVDDILTLASIIEKEAFGKEQMSNISSVLYNRLESGMQLQCDVTISYVEGAIKPFITGDINRYNSDYNTYKCAALPAGPICNPGLDAIEAALAPAQTDYLYFVTDQDKNYYYASDWDTHLKNLEKAGLTTEEAGSGADGGKSAAEAAASQEQSVSEAETESLEQNTASLSGSQAA